MIVLTIFHNGYGKDLDLAEIAIEEEVTTDKAQLDTDTDVE